MASTQNSSSLIQQQAEQEMFANVQKHLGVSLVKNQKINLCGDTFMQPDFYSEEHGIVGEIFAHIGKPKKAQDNKIANDILKMLLLDKIKDRKHRKIIVVCDESEKRKLEGTSALAESIRQFGIEVMLEKVSSEMHANILQAQALQKMTNAE